LRVRRISAHFAALPQWRADVIDLLSLMLAFLFRYFSPFSALRYAAMPAAATLPPLSPLITLASPRFATPLIFRFY